MSVIDYSESRYYGDVAADVLRLALNAPTGIPRSSTALLANMTYKGLMAAYKATPQLAIIASLDKKLLNQVAMRYRVFFGAMNGQLDGALGYEDADALYLTVRGFTLRDEAPRLGRFLALDFAHFLAERKPHGVRALLLIDEVNALRMRDETSILFEQARSFGAGIVISSQSYAGLGQKEVAERILGAANSFILHQCSDPEEIAKRAGRMPIVRSNWGVTMGAATAQGRMQLYEDWKVHPDLIRQQGLGEAFIINGGRAQQVRFAPVNLPSIAIADAWGLIHQEEAEQQALRAAAAQQAQRQSVQASSSAPGSKSQLATRPASASTKKAPAPQSSAHGQPSEDANQAAVNTTIPSVQSDDEADRIS